MNALCIWMCCSFRPALASYGNSTAFFFANRILRARRVVPLDSMQPELFL